MHTLARLLPLICLLHVAQAFSQSSTTSPLNLMINARRDEFFAYPPHDACSDLVRRIEDKEIALDTSSRLALTRNLLLALDVPVSSQLLVFSSTASQGTRVNTGNPRAIYFNDEVYVGLVPGGFVEMIGIDPLYGPVWYSIERIVGGEAPVPQRSTDCFRCHNSGSGVSAMVMRNLIPNEAARLVEVTNGDAEGHHQNFAMRFGGFHVTSVAPLSHSREGLVTLLDQGKPARKHLKVGERYDPKLHLTTTSDVVAHLVHAHQLGFVNLAAQVNTYARDGRINSPATSQPTFERLAPMVERLVRYMLFADEAPLPVGGVTGLPDFVRDFAANRKPDKHGAALKDFDLRTRMFKYRCSYMIYTRQWSEMPPVAKTIAYAKLKAALTGDDPFYAYLPEEERRAIWKILLETLPDVPADWRLYRRCGIASTEETRIDE